MSKELIRQFTHEVKNGPINIKYYFDLDKGGMVGSEIEYLDGFGNSDYEDELKLPITKRTFYNPETQSFVGYQRAIQLKLINKQPDDIL